MVLPFLSLHLKDHLGLSAGTAAQLLSCYGVGSICGSLIGGKLSSHYGPIRVLIVAFVAVAPVFLLLLHSSTVYSAAGAIFLLSLVGDAIRPAAMTATADLCPDAILSRAFALNRLAVNLGMSIGPAFAGFLYLSNFSLIFYIDAASCLFAAVLVGKIFGWPPCPIRNRSEKESRDTNSRLRDDWIMIAVLVQFCCVMVIFLQTVASYPIYLRETYHVSEPVIGLLFTINTGLIVLFEMVLIVSIERFPKLPIIGIGCALMCLGFGAMPMGSSAGFLCLTVVIWTLGEMLSMPLLTTWIGQRAPADQRGTYLGAMTALFSIAWIIAPVFGGFMYSIHPNLIWHCSLGLMFLVSIGFAIASRLEKPEAVEQDAVWASSESNAQ